MLRKSIKAIRNAAIGFQTVVKVGALALLVLSVLVANLMNFAASWRKDMPPTKEAVSRYEKRLAALRRALPQRGVVGYVNDATSREQMLARFHVTQYALAPLIVVRMGSRSDRPLAGPSLVIGDFTNAAAAKRIIGTGLRVRQDFGGGVLLLEAEHR